MYTTIQHLRSELLLLFFKENNTLIQQGCIKLIKSESKGVYD